MAAWVGGTARNAHFVKSGTDAPDEQERKAALPQGRSTPFSSRGLSGSLQGSRFGGAFKQKMLSESRQGDITAGQPGRLRKGVGLALGPFLLSCNHLFNSSWTMTSRQTASLGHLSLLRPFDRSPPPPLPGTAWFRAV